MKIASDQYYNVAYKKNPNKEKVNKNNNKKKSVRAPDQRKERNLEREGLKSDQKKKVIQSNKASFKKKEMQPKKNTKPNEEKKKEPDKQPTKSAKEWGQATNDPRKKTT